tara:strand:+ start:1324 stop:4011 length:2688 start_codon:yes stop_codon:yes gene_type:complete
MKMMEKNKVKELVQRFSKRFYKKKDHYWMDYGTRFNPTRDPKTNKIKYSASPGDKYKPFWYSQYTLDEDSYNRHLTKALNNIPNSPDQMGHNYMEEARNELNEQDFGIIIPPCDLDGDSETKGLAQWGALDEDIYKDPEHLKRIVKQVYDEKLPLAPCYSKSGGLHLYLVCKETTTGVNIVRALEHFKNKLKCKAKEIFPKQTKPKWDDKKERWSPGNGILVPYKSSILCESVEAPEGSLMVHQHKYSYRQPENPWIKNENMETGNLEEFLDYLDSIEIDESFFGDLPLDLKEETVKDEAKTEVSDARPLSDLDDILSKIRNNVEHEKGGEFDNWIVDYVAKAIGKHNQSDDEILDDLNKIKDKSDKAKDDNYFKDKISNCRNKFGKTDPGPEKKQFMSNVVFLMDEEKYIDFRVGKTWGERALEVKYHKIFGGGITAPTYFKKHQTENNIAESRKYRPGDWDENKPVFQDKDNLVYYNFYRPGPLKPRKVEKHKDIERFFKLLEFMVPIAEYREYVLDFMAGIIQNPGHKWRFALFWYSKAKQVGKGSLFRVMELILGEDNTMETNVRLMTDKGSMYTDKQLVLIDECKSKGDWQEKRELANDLKIILTGKRVSARRMRVDYKQVENNANFMIFSNDPGAISIDDDDKRYLVLFHDQQRLPQKFYDDFHDWLEGPDKTKKDGTDGGAELLYDYFKRRPIKLKLMAPPPETIYLKEMANHTQDTLQQTLEKWMSEENGPFALECGDIRGTTELEKYITMNCTGTVVKMASNPKVLKETLLKMGAVFRGQIRHKIRKEKPTLCIIRNHKKYEGIKDVVLCNEHWKPLIIERQTYRAVRNEDDHTVETIQKASEPENVKRFEEHLTNGKSMPAEKKYTAKEILAEGRPDEENIGPNN